MVRRKGHPFRAVFREDPLGWSKIETDGYGAGYVGAIHKRELEGRRCRFANEVICGRIAQSLLLPCPPFAITFFESQTEVRIKNEMLFSSLDFDYERDSSPPPDFDACYERLPELCAGILAFDILVANPDRVRRNIWCDDTVEPTRLLIFDHDYGLLGDDTEGVGRIQAIRSSNSLGLHFGNEGANHHPFLERIDSARLFDRWYKKMRLLPRWFIEQTVRDAKAYRIDKAESDAVAELLLHRARNIEGIIEANKAAFPRILDWQGFLQ